MLLWDPYVQTSYGFSKIPCKGADAPTMGAA